MKTYKIELTENDMILISQALGAMPYHTVFALIPKIQAQYDAQNQNMVSINKPKLNLVPVPNKEDSDDK